MNGWRAWTICGVLLIGAGWIVAVASAESEPIKARGPIVVRFVRIDPPVVAQRDVTVAAPAAPHLPDPVPIECSGIAWINGRLLISSDRHQHLIFTCDIDTSTMTIGLPEPVQVIRNQQYLLDDAESVAVRPQDGGGTLMHAYVLCSLSNDPDAVALPQRRHLLSFQFDTTERPIVPKRVRVVDSGTIRNQINAQFLHLGVRLYHTYNRDAERNTYRWGNVEGIAVVPRKPGADPSEMSMLLGLRNPLIHEQAVVAAVTMPTEPDSDAMKLSDLFVLDLGGRGIADLCWDPVTRGYLIVGTRSNGPKLDPDQPFPPNTLDAALFWWSGRKAERPVLFAEVPDMKIEAVCRLGDLPYIAFVSDEGDVSEGRPQRQSVLTIMHFNGLASER